MLVFVKLMSERVLCCLMLTLALHYVYVFFFEENITYMLVLRQIR
jgi:hypothetical protein